MFHAELTKKNYLKTYFMLNTNIENLKYIPMQYEYTNELVNCTT